jgi:hypothetical protein
VRPFQLCEKKLYDVPQVLETVCNKKGFDPATHRLQHHRKFLDTSNTIRFSGTGSSTRRGDPDSKIELLTRRETVINFDSIVLETYDQ